MDNEDNKIRPTKGAMWFMQMQNDYWDSDFNNTFSGITCTAHGFLGFIKSYIALNWCKLVRSTEVTIKANVLIATIDDDRLATLEDVTDMSQKFMVLRRLDTFQVSEDKKFITFGIKKMLKWLDIHSKNEVKREIRMENINACADKLSIPHSLNDSTRDEWVQYIYTLHYTLEKTRKKNGFTRDAKFDAYGEYDKDYNYVNESLNITSKNPIHKGKDIKEDKRAYLSSNNNSNNRGQFEWEHVDSDASHIKLRNSRTQDEYYITDSDLVNDSNKTLEEKYYLQFNRNNKRNNPVKPLGIKNKNIMSG